MARWRAGLAVKTRWLAILIVIAAVVAAAGRFHATQDDSFISYRYARNLVETGGLTFNGPGYERVEGYSNFTWTLALALAYAIGIGPWLASKLLGLACLVATILGTMRLAGEMLPARSPWRLFAGLAVASSACTTSWSVEGLETPSIAALIVWSLVFVLAALREENEGPRRRKAWLAGAALGVLGVSRPETALFGIVALGWIAALRVVDRERSSGVLGRMAIAFAVPVLAQLAFRLAYYGRVTANTVYAKVRGGGQLRRGGVYAEEFVRAHGTWLVVAAIVLVVVALVVEARRRPRQLRAPLLTILFFVAYAAFIVAAGGDWMRGFRFFVHVMPLLAVVGTWALARVSEATAGRIDRRLRIAAIAAAAAAVLFANTVLAPRHPFGAQGAVYDGAGPGYHMTLSPPPGPHLRVGEWLRENVPRDTLVALSEAGIVAFESRLPVLDYLGLNDRHVADLMQRGADDAAIADHVLRQRPGAIVMTGESSANGVFTGRMPIDRALQGHADFAPYRLAKIEPLALPTAAGTPAFAIYLRR